MTQTRHPEELLAEYVDGTLDERDRRSVEDHLATCATCRDELGLAAGARQSLRRLPEEAVPLGVTRPVMDEASSREQRERASWGHRIQWAGGIAAAAAIVAVAAVTLPGLGGDASDRGGGAAVSAEAGDSAMTTPQSPQERLSFTAPLEMLDRGFDERALSGLATEVAKAVREGALQAPAAEGTPEETRQAHECVTRWAGSAEDDLLVRLMLARYEGEAAYVAVYLRGPDVGRPPTRAIVWVASADGSCELLDVTQIRI